MKSFAVFLFVFVIAVVAQEQTADYFTKLESFKADCITESSARPDLVDRMLQMGEFNDDRGVKCFVKCLLVKMNVMTNEGEIQEDVMRSQVPPDAQGAKVDMMVQKCKDLKGADACDTAYIVVKCSYDIFAA